MEEWFRETCDELSQRHHDLSQKHGVESVTAQRAAAYLYGVQASYDAWRHFRDKEK